MHAFRRHSAPNTKLQATVVWTEDRCRFYIYDKRLLFRRDTKVYLPTDEKNLGENREENWQTLTVFQNVADIIQNLSPAFGQAGAEKSVN